MLLLMWNYICMIHILSHKLEDFLVNDLNVFFYYLQDYNNTITMDSWNRVRKCLMLTTKVLSWVVLGSSLYFFFFFNICTSYLSSSCGLCVQCCMLPVSLYCPFSIVPSVISNVCDSIPCGQLSTNPGKSVTARLVNFRHVTRVYNRKYDRFVR